MLITSSAYAKGINVYVELPDGQKVSLNGLTNNQRRAMIESLEQTAKANNPETVASKVIPEAIRIIDKDPEELDKWRKLIVGTIKDTCNDLNVTVNEFAKSPVGIGVVGLILYKIVGKDLITGVIRITIAGIMWVLITIILGIITKYFMGSTLIYEHVEEIPQEKGKPIIKRYNPVKKFRYPWRSNDARCTLAVAIGIIFFLNCITTLLVMS